MSGTANIDNYYSTIQPVLAKVYERTPAGTATSEQQKQALTDIANEYNSESQEFKNAIENQLHQQISKYATQTEQLNNYNEIFNTNTYIHKELTSAEKGMRALTEKLKNKIYTSKQKTQAYEYEKNKLQFFHSLFVTSAFIVIVLITLAGASIAGQISTKFLYIVMGFSVSVYLFIVLSILYSNSFRSHSDWNKFVWTNNKPDSNKTCE